MDWDDLRVFLAVARDNSLSRGAKRLAMDASTAGRRIVRLEAALGHALFLKSPQGYELTSEGARLLPHAEAAERALEAASDSLGHPDEIGGQLRIGAPDGCANYLLPQVVAAICDAHPQLEVQIVALPRVFNLSKREADVAIAVSPPASGRLIVQRLCDYRLHLTAHRDYLAGRPPLAGLSDLRRHRLIGYIPDMIFDRELDYLAPLLARSGAEPARLSSNSVAVQMQAIRCGAGIGIVHDFAIPFAPGLVRVLTNEFSLQRSFWIIRHADDRRSHRLNRLTDELAKGLRAELARLETAAGANEDA
ncbi:MAG: LysR family transcriptional regulator [Paracoccus sp. (in: a-proteobacteria)]